MVVDVWQKGAESSMTVAVLDSDNNALTADDNANNTADYSYDLTADSCKYVTFKLTNAQANRRYQLGALCSFINAECSEWSVTETGWEVAAANPPKGLKNLGSGFNYTDDISTNTALTSYDQCFVPAKNAAGNRVVVLDEDQDVRIKTKICSDASTAPSANTADICGMVALDASWEDGADTKAYFDFYKHDVDQDPTAVGISDTIRSVQGLTSGAIVELQ